MRDLVRLGFCSIRYVLMESDKQRHKAMVTFSTRMGAFQSRTLLNVNWLPTPKKSLTIVLTVHRNRTEFPRSAAQTSLSTVYQDKPIT
ncbi:Protein CBG25398 [Caenorhabditis briggsae]|uniref:Protein CBG25398 n=1 Tax=Caenorhabditis briggsae TaxID=6238 RepID=B6IH50_CAEBR|nr:Protein CBG25398 [Caenorhabditis briggsae]CAR99230.1 Protein CBG25398 [Caenorhabditis briggsae]